MSNEHTRPVRRSEAEWREIFAAFTASGLSQAAFCRREGLALSTFQYHRRRWREAAEAPAEQPAVIDLGELGGARRGGWEVEIALGDGVSLSLRRR